MMPKISGATNQFPKQPAQTFGNSQATAPSRMPTVPTSGKRPLPTPPPPKKINAQLANNNVKMPSPYTAPATIETPPAPTKPIEKKPAQNQKATNLVFPSNNFSASASIPVSTRPPAVAPCVPRAVPPASIKPPMLVTPFCTFAYPVPEKEAAYIANSRACKRIADGQGPNSWSEDVKNLREARGDLPKNWDKIGWNPNKSQENLDYALGKIDATITTTQSFKDSWLNNPLQTIDDIKDYEKEKTYLIGELDFTFNYINYLNDLKTGNAGTLPSEPDATLTGINLLRNPVKEKPPTIIPCVKGTTFKGEKFRNGEIVTLTSHNGEVTRGKINLLSKNEMKNKIEKENRQKLPELVLLKGTKNTKGKEIQNGEVVLREDPISGTTTKYIVTVITEKEARANQVIYEKKLAELNAKQENIKVLDKKLKEIEEGIKADDESIAAIRAEKYENRKNFALMFKTNLIEIKKDLNNLPYNWINNEMRDQLLPEYTMFLKDTILQIEQLINDFPNLKDDSSDRGMDFKLRTTSCAEQIDQANTLLYTLEQMRTRA